MSSTSSRATAQPASVEHARDLDRVGVGKRQSVSNETTRKRVSDLAQACDGSCLVRERVEVVHHPGQVQVRVRVEALEEALALVLQVALDLEVDVEGGALADALATELVPQALLGDVRDVGHHPGHREPDPWCRAGAVVVAAREVLVVDDRRARDGGERDVLRR